MLGVGTIALNQVTARSYRDRCRRRRRVRGSSSVEGENDLLAMARAAGSMVYRPDEPPEPGDRAGVLSGYGYAQVALLEPRVECSETGTPMSDPHQLVSFCKPSSRVFKSLAGTTQQEILVLDRTRLHRPYKSFKSIASHRTSAVAAGRGSDRCDAVPVNPISIQAYRVPPRRPLGPTPGLTAHLVGGAEEHPAFRLDGRGRHDVSKFHSRKNAISTAITLAASGASVLYPKSDECLLLRTSAVTGLASIRTVHGQDDEAGISNPSGPRIGVHCQPSPRWLAGLSLS